MSFLTPPQAPFIVLSLACGFVGGNWPRCRLPLLAVAGVGFLATYSQGAAVGVLAMGAFAHLGSSVDRPGLRRSCAAGVCAVFGLYRWSVSETAVLTQVVSTLTLSYAAFHALSMLVGRYRSLGTTSLWGSFAYVSYFPHLVAGPVVDPAYFDRQVRSSHPLDLSRATRGLESIFVGIAAKYLLGDQVTRLVVDGIHPRPYPLNTVSTLSSALSIMLDVFGYTMVARGAAHLAGIDLRVHLYSPLTASRSVQEFFQRWQLTNTAFLRDRVYGPLRGRNPGRARSVLALMGVMAFVVTWHGWNVPSALFGALVFLGLAGDRLLARRGASARRHRVALLVTVGVPAMVCALRMRAGQDLTWSGLARQWEGVTNTTVHDPVMSVLLVSVQLAGLLVLDWTQSRRRDVLDPGRLPRGGYARAGVVAVGLIAALVFVSRSPSASFVYGRF